MRRAPLAWFSSKEDAVHVKRALTAAGIRTYLGSRDQHPPGWFMGQTQGVYLWVSESELETAAALMEALRPVAE